MGAVFATMMHLSGSFLTQGLTSEGPFLFRGSPAQKLSKFWDQEAPRVLIASCIQISNKPANAAQEMKYFGKC